MRRREVLLPPKRSLAFEQLGGLEVGWKFEQGGREAADEKRIEVDWRDKSKSVRIWEFGEESSTSGVNKYEAVSEKVKVGEEKRKLSDERRKLSDEGRKLSNEKRKVSDEKRKVSDEKRKVSDEKRKTSDEKRKTNDEKRTTSDERRKTSDERRRQMSEKAKEEGREKLSQFIRKEIVYPHLLQVRLFFIFISFDIHHETQRKYKIMKIKAS